MGDRDDQDPRPKTPPRDAAGHPFATEQGRVTLDFSGPELQLPSKQEALRRSDAASGPDAPAPSRGAPDAWTIDRIARTTMPPPGHGPASKPPPIPPPPRAPSNMRRLEEPRPEPRPEVRRSPSGPPLPLDDPPDAISLIDRSPRSEPPPLDLAAEMTERYALGDFTGALTAAELLLGQNPRHAEAGRCAENSRAHLAHLYSSRLGPLDVAPRLTVDVAEARWLGVDHRANELLGLIDGMTTFDELLERSGLERIEALKMLTELLEAGAFSIPES
jgi:hypothetical protein